MTAPDNQVFVVTNPAVYISTDTDGEPYYQSTPTVTSVEAAEDPSDGEPFYDTPADIESLGAASTKVSLDIDGVPFIEEAEEGAEQGEPEPVGLSNVPFYIKQRQDWAREQEIYRHDQGLWQIGELVEFLLMWHVEDYHNGLVQRCTTCYGGTDLDARAAAAFNQPTKAKCPDCFGTTFEGGYRAKIVRPALITDADDQETVAKRGAVNPQTISVESTADFRFRNNDYLVRKDNSRWSLGAPQRVTLRSGFSHPDQIDTSIGYALTQANLEYENSPVYMIPPTDNASIAAMLSEPSRYPATPTDVLNGPLIPPAWTD